jgi:hypothetical protein
MMTHDEWLEERLQDPEFAYYRPYAGASTECDFAFWENPSRRPLLRVLPYWVTEKLAEYVTWRCERWAGLHRARHTPPDADQGGGESP